jgi:electron-transferring-flavoprotein dehydrogenase
VDEAWTTGTQLAEAVIELLDQKKLFTRANLEQTYVRLRRASWVDRESKIAANARNGFHYGVARGLIGMVLAAYTRGAIHFVKGKRPRRFESLGEQCAGRILPDELNKIQKECAEKHVPLHDAVMNRLGWPEIECDGQLLISHQDALLMGGSVQAAAGYPNHVVFLRPGLCKDCEPKLCVEMCSGQAITRGENSVPVFDREKCVYCGACLWNCATGNIEFRAGAGGLHSALN